MDDLLPGALLVIDRGSKDRRFHSARRVARFINNVFLGRPPDSPFDGQPAPQLEDVLSQLDLALDGGRPLAGRYSIEALRNLLADLVYMICEVPRDRLDGGRTYREPEMPGDSRCLREAFVSRLGDDDTIVSLNHDIVIDNGLAEPSSPGCRRRPAHQPIAPGPPPLGYHVKSLAAFASAVSGPTWQGRPG